MQCLLSHCFLCSNLAFARVASDCAEANEMFFQRLLTCLPPSCCAFLLIKFSFLGFCDTTTLSCFSAFLAGLSALINPYWRSSGLDPGSSSCLYSLPWWCDPFHDFQYHLYADDSKLFIFSWIFLQGSGFICNCLLVVSLWMSHRQLKLSINTELLSFPSKPGSIQSSPSWQTVSLSTWSLEQKPGGHPWLFL